MDDLDPPFGEEDGFEEEEGIAFPARHGPRGAGADGPTNVCFSVFVDPAPEPGQVVVLKGTLPELEEGRPLQPCETGHGRLWTVTVQLNVAGAASAAAVPRSLFGGLLGSGSGMRGGSSSTPLFEVHYAVVADGRELRSTDQKKEPATAPLRANYYHCAKFPHASKDEAFPAFVHNEVHLLQSGQKTSKEFMTRFIHLVQSPFAQKRSLLEQALDELIVQHWGPDAPAPQQTVLAVAATLGYFRRQRSQAQHSYAFASLGFDADSDLLMGGLSMPAAAQEKEKEPPMSLTVCRWIVKHCPAREDLNQDPNQDAATDRHARDRRRDGHLSSCRQDQYETLGVLQAAETLYTVEKKFEWLKLLNFLPEHHLPSPLDSSRCTPEEREQLAKSFRRELNRLFEEFQEQEQQLEAQRRDTDDAKQTTKVMQRIEQFLSGLAKYCPSVDGLRVLIGRVVQDRNSLLDSVVDNVVSRLRSLNFGQEDKEALKLILRECPFMHTDACAVALLSNQHHPSDEFQAQEIVRFIRDLTETRGEVRPAGAPLQSAMRRWLLRLYGRPPERPERRQEERPRTAAQELEAQRPEIREAIRSAIRGWRMVLELQTFSREEETLRMILFELSQAYFFKDPNPLLVLSCMLDLEETDISSPSQSSVRQLEVELRRIVVKSVRDTQDTSDAEQGEELLRLLFEQPTPLRFHVIEQFISFRQASADLRRILANEPIWTRLLSKTWVGALKLKEEYPLSGLQKNGQSLLEVSAKQLKNGTIPLNTLHTILEQRTVYEKLVAQVMGDAPSTISESKDEVEKFDKEHRELGVYVRLFCSPAKAHIDVKALDKLLEDIKVNYATMELNNAVAKFQGLRVRDHLPWLWSLRGSNVFSDIWGQVARGGDGRSPKDGGLKQDYVVDTVIPKAKQMWEKLAFSIEHGDAVLDGIRWCTDLQWVEVDKELKLLECTAPKTAPWVPKAVERTQAMRLAAKLRAWAPSMLHIRKILGELFAPTKSVDKTVEELKTVVAKSEGMWDMSLGQMVDHVAPFRDTINKLTEPAQDYVIAAAKHDASLKWLLDHKKTEDFNRLVSLGQQNTDDPVILAALASLKQTRTFLAELLYKNAPYKDLWAFLLELATLNVDHALHMSLQLVQQSYEPMINLLTQQSRAPGVQACYDLQKISQHGRWQVVCSLRESDQIRVKALDSEFKYEDLVELRRQLLMTDVPAELEGAADLPKKLEEFVDKFKLLEQYGRCAMELFTLGHFAYRADQDVLSVMPDMTVLAVRDELTGLLQKLEKWQKAVEDARGKHYFLNYFTVRELCHLVKTVPRMASPASCEEAWLAVWPLLRVVDLTAKDSVIKGQVTASLRLLEKAGDDELRLLNALGELLTKLFESAKPQVRPLPGLYKGLAAGSSQQLQGDLLMRSLQHQEVGKPIFVCCADEVSKVTEMVLSIYARRERVPEAEELLLCSSSTSLEEIELLLCRFFHARDHSREDRLYCLGNVHLLPYVVQCGTVEALRKLESKFGFKSASALVFVSGMQNQMLTNSLNQHNLAMRALPLDILKMAVSKVGELYHGRQLEAVMSTMNGVGKTHHILRQVAEIQKMNENKPVLHHVELRETTDISALVASLLADPTDPRLPTAVYIDLAHILPSHVDSLLFELLIVGVLRDPKHCAVYHRRKQDAFFVEIPNTPSDHTAKQMPFCRMLPLTYLRMGPDKLDLEMPVLKSDTAIYVEFIPNKCLSIVGKTLDAMKYKKFNPRSAQFQVGWTAEKAPTVDTRTIYTLLEEYCCSDTSPAAFLVFTNFVNFLGNLVLSAEQWNMMNLQLLQHFDPGLKHFKDCFFMLLMETSRDFALRQVPKTMTVHDRASPLAPASVRSIVRGTSGTHLTPHTPFSPPAVARTQISPAAVNEEAGGVGRVAAIDYAPRFDQMSSWENSRHPIASFRKNDNGHIIGCNIMSLKKDFLGDFIDPVLQNSLSLNDLKLERDWTKVTYEEAVQLVIQIEGGDLLRRTEHATPSRSPDYVVTIDNLLKLMSIQQRLKYGLPVILMGETGCGKTALVKFLSKTLHFRLMTLDIHGGITDQAIIDFLDKAIEESNSNDTNQRGVLVFFDEINAANCMALFKTIIIDRVYGNKVIPPRIRIISCCNPYRIRKTNELEQVALVFQHQATNNTTAVLDPMKSLVYRVHPLPESLIDVVSDFGALSERSEELYINSIIRKELRRVDQLNPADAQEPNEFDTFLDAFRDLLCQSQSFVREVNGGERSVVSMRDIARAARVFKWFLTQYFRLRGVENIAVTIDDDGVMSLPLTPDTKPHLRNAVILTLGYCYHARLNRDERWVYRKRICTTWKKMLTDRPSVQWLNLENANDLDSMLIETQLQFVSEMDLGEGIALNEALRENLFMLLVSIMNQIPILLIGKPGCSKSLAMGVLQQNLIGEVSNKKIFKTMPSVDVFAYQCSPLSTPEAILSAFRSARQSNLKHESNIVCVLLDEVGLAEESPHLPLKVLHRELEDLQGIACVGISNWALDAAKMSRCVTLYRPPPTIEDLCVTAEGMVASANLKAYLKPLSTAFHMMYKNQSPTRGAGDFWGMREFYSTVRVINMELKKRASEGLEAVLEPQVLMKTVQRNFGGQSASDLDQCVEEFFERCSMDENGSGVKRYTIPELIQQNLKEPDARHLMLLTKNNAALRLLFESNLIDHSTAKVMFGSTFSSDQSDIFVAMNLQKIKGFMQQPISLVLVHCDSLYESLYDLLNQHYMEFAGQRYVRIAHGSKAKQCPIHRLFRVIVVTEMYDAYYRLPPPLLNRFEKQVFLRKDLMTKADEALLAKLTRFWNMLLGVVNDWTHRDKPDGDITMGPKRASLASEAEHDQDGEGPRHRPVVGYHPEMLNSLVVTLRRRFGSDKSIDQLFALAKELLMWVMTPEAVCIVASRCDGPQLEMKFGVDLVSEYFHKQRHSDLPSFTEDLIQNRSNWCDDLGAQVMITTFSPIRGYVKGDLEHFVSDGGSITEVSLHEFSSSQDIDKAVNSFYVGAAGQAEGGKRFLLIHADPAAASLRVIEHARFVCETERAGAHAKLTESGAAGSMFVLLIVHLQRGTDAKFSFDFDSQWHFAFLDSVEPSVDLNSMPLLGDMLQMPLIQVVQGLNFEKLLQTCFRASLSRLIYPKSRKPEDLHQQIQLILSFLADAEFVKLVRDWVLCILETTPKNSQNEEEGSFGADTTWFAAIAMAAHELAMAGTFRAALHNRVAVLVGSLLTVLLAHLDRNQGLALLQEPPKRTLWLNMCRASLTSNLSLQLKHQAVQALSEDASAQHEVGTDAQTGAKPFVSRFPASWFASKSIDGERHMMESLPPEKQLAALEEQYKISMLQEVGLDPVLPSELLDDYLHDFTAMHVDWTARIDRSTQTRILSKTLTRFMNQVSPVQRQVTSILEVHQAFWRQEKQVDYFIKLLNAVPDAVPQAERLIETSDLSTLILNMLLLVHETLSNELLQVDESLFTLAWVEERARVLDRDLRQLSKEELQSMGRSLFYREWLQRKMVVANLSRDYMSSVEGARDSALLRELKTDKEPRLETLSLMFQQVACALKLPLEVVKKFLKHLPEGKIRHPRSLLAILTLAQDVAGCPQGLEACGAFCESWLLDVCLRDAETISDMDETALRLICGLAAGLPVVVEKNSVVGVTSGKISDWSETAESGIAALPGTGGVIPRSSCLNLALLRKLLVTSRHDARQIAVRTIEELLLEVSRREGHNDTTFATRYTVLMEEDFESKMKDACEPHNWPDISLQAVFSPDRSRSPATMLEEVGKIRWMLQRYADVLCQDSVNHAAHDACAEKVDGLLQTDDEQLEKVCRSLRMFLLKCIERRKGVSFLRALLDARPLSDTGWVTKWRTNHDIEFEKFIGAALVPKWNPFTGQDGSPEYNEAKAAIFEMMSSTSTAKLDQFAKSIASKEGIQQKRSIGGFLLAVCQELGLHSALETADRPPQWRGPLNEWLATTKALPVTDQERMLLRIFAGDASAIAQLPEDDGAPLGPFVVSGGRKMDDLLKFRLLGHIASVCISAPSSSLLASLREIMLRPKSLMPDMFLPSMDEDIRNRVMKALLERGENIWKFKSHWYSCVCGYSFFIGECGRPMEVATCPQCAKPIGGRDHNPTTNSLVDEEKDRSPHGYMLPVADKDEKHISFREIPASSTRAVRLLLHGCMFCGIAGHVDVHEHRVPRIYENIVNRDTMCTMYEGGHKEGMYIADHFAHDLEQMTAIMSSNPECLVMAMHALLTRMSVQLKDVPKGKTGAAGQVASGSADEVNWEKLDLPSRNAWEETIEATYLNEMVKNYDTSTQEFHARWGAGAAEDGKFVAELMEAADVQGFPTKKRDQELPQLWAFRSPVTLGALHQRIGMQSDGKNDLPVLTTVLQQQVWKVMRALRCLVGVFDWHALVMSAFSGRITRAQAQDLRVGDVLEGQAPSEREKWERAFEDLQKAWSIAWSSVERYECQEIPQHMKSVSLTRNSAMVYCIADPQNEGICPLALTQFLVERHNELVQVVSSANGYPVKKVSTRLLAQHDVVNYNGSQLMKFLKSRCVTYGVGGKLNFAFKQLEQKLRRELSRPELTMEVRGFNWLGESFAIGSQLRTVLPQRDLAADVVARIREEVTSPSVASQMVQEVQITISFILKSGVAFGKNAGNTFLAEYFKSVCLQNSVQCLPSNTARAEVQLRHLDSFIKLLKQIMNKDPMENVDDKYKEPLPEEMKKALLAAKPNLPAILIQVLATFAEARLVETSLKDSEGMLEILEHAQDEFADAGTHAFRAVQQHFPQKLQMKHWVAVYNTLKQPNGKPLDTDVL